MITPHNIRITVKNGEVTRAITDGRYDEINKQMLAPEEREKTASVQLIFYRTINGQEKPVAVEQKIKYNDSIEKATLKELLAGPQEENIYSLIDENTEILDFKIKDNKAKVNFSGEIEPAGGSAWVAAIKTQIKRTLTQFDSIEKVEIAVEGETEAILQP
ncbi:MAG: GerMN domain-containing protein [bacterium]